MRSRKNPLKEFEQFFEQFSGVVSDFPIDIVESEEDVTISADLPGYDEEHITVEVGSHGRKLTISAEKSHEMDSEGESVVVSERKHVSVSRSIPLPQNVDVDSATAQYNNGVLHITVDKVEDQSGGVEIDVE